MNREMALAVDVENLYHRYGPMVLRRCRALLKDEQAALEAMQDVFVQVVRRQDAMTVDAPSSMLYTTATHVCLNQIRHGRRHPTHGGDELIERIARAPDTEHRLGASLLLDKLFDREPPSTRVIATLHLVDGMTWEEVAEHMGMSVSGVRKRMRLFQAQVEQHAEATP